MEIYFQFIIKIFKTLFYDEALIFFTSFFLFFYSIFIFAFKKNYKFLTKLFIFFIPFFFIIYAYSFLPDYFHSLGQDSLLELRNPNTGEFLFYIKTFFISIFDLEILKRNRFWLVLVTSLTSSLTLFILINSFYKESIIKIEKFLNYFFIAAILASAYSSLNLAKKFYSSGKQIAILEKDVINNTNNITSSKNINDDLLIVTYIGESTAALNMGLYGYPLKTTPWLNKQIKNNNFLKFKSVFSEHTHTTPALLKSLSLCFENCSISKENSYKYFLPLVDLANKAAVDTYSYSAQGDNGMNNLASRLVLRTNKIKDFAYNSEKKREEKLKGDRFIPSVKDHKYFQDTYCKNNEIFNNKKSSLVFLHSYAGHGAYGGYKTHIPKDFGITYPEYLNKKNFLGKNSANFKSMQEYDSAIKYIDYSLSQTIKCTFDKSKQNNKPVIFIYFSDHGESAASAKGHDSSRINYEMLHIPFFLYFNDAAYELYKDKFDILQKIKNKNFSSKIISEIILFLFEIDIFLEENKENVYSWKNFPFLKTNHIVERELLNNEKRKIYTFWNNDSAIKNIIKEENFNDYDVSIRLWQLNNYLALKKISDKKNIKNLVCQHRANSFVIQFRSSMSNGCFETDIFFLKDKVISAHGKDNDTNLLFNDFLRSNYQKNTIWLDSKNIHNANNCGYAYNWLNKNIDKFLSLLIEIPSASVKSLNNKEWLNCINKINNISNVEVAYYLNTDLSNKCSKDILLNNRNSKNCMNLYSDIFKITDQTNIKSLTFDYRAAYQAVNNNDKLNFYKWHVWHVDSIEIFNKLILDKKIGIILLQNNKNLSNLN